MATILIIEDDRETNDAICEYLKSAGHNVFPVYDGAEALTIFAQRSIDLIVLDIMLPTIMGLTKPFSMVLLGRRIMALLRRNGNANVLNTIAFDDVIVDFSGYTAKDPNGKIDITPKEIDLLKLLVEHKGLVLTRTQILDNLWGSDASIIDRTADVYIRNLRKKLRLDCIITVKGIGYKYEVDE